MWRLIALAPAIIIIVAFAALFSSLSSSDDDAGVYVSLGDSVAAGIGASDPASTSFAAILASYRGLTLRNVATAGATSQDVLEKQVPEYAAIAAGKHVALVTIVAGGNDLGTLVANPTCLEQPLPDTCPIAEALDIIDGRLDHIVRFIRETDADVPIALLAYPNFFSGTGHMFEQSAGLVLARLDGRIREVAARYDRVAVADAAPVFDGAAGDLTHVLDAQPDPHPNDAGHRAIADAFDTALRDMR
jgi:lysophospholipase L1-like esterase